MDHTRHTPLQAAELNETNLIGAVIYGPYDERIGTVSHVHEMGSTSQVIVDVGGFLGLGSKPVSIQTNQVNFMRDESGGVHAVTSWTKEQVKELPEHHH